MPVVGGEGVRVAAGEGGGDGVKGEAVVGAGVGGQVGWEMGGAGRERTRRRMFRPTIRMSRAKSTP